MKRIFALVLCLIICLPTLAACGNTCKVSIREGDSVLSTESVEVGAMLDYVAPDRAGYLFAGLFAAPDFSEKFNMGTPVTEDLTLYAAYVPVARDSRSFAIVGSGTSTVLASSSWGAVIGDAHTMTHKYDSGFNTYVLTVDLEAGDEFQFATDTSWSDQRGFGYLIYPTRDGPDYFSVASGLGAEEPKLSNIVCNVSGTYTFTLVTYPGGSELDASPFDYILWSVA